jgi:hypothetical protein
LSRSLQPPQILQIHRDRLKPGSDAAYGGLEQEIARMCLSLGCPHPYLAVESQSGPKEVWYFNGYRSLEERQQVVDAYAHNAPLIAGLGQYGALTAPLTVDQINVFATYRPEISLGEAWTLGERRYLVALVTTVTRDVSGTVFDSADGTRFVFAGANTREEAESLAPGVGPEAQVFAVRPGWSMPDPHWIAADPAFWHQAAQPNGVM